MARARGVIFYGVCGEGYGHFARACFLVPELMRAGYELELFASGHVAAMLAGRFRGCACHEVPGFRMRYRSNALDVMGTMLNTTRITLGWFAACAQVMAGIRRRHPVAAVSDYEFSVAWGSCWARVPMLALGNQQMATECDVSWGAVSRRARALLVASNVMTYCRPAARMITSFFHPPLKPCRWNPQCRRWMVGPVLREDVLRRQPARGDHVLVYQTSSTLHWLDRILDALPGRKRVYISGPGARGAAEGFDEQAFLDDLASCRFAVVNGGHMTISEALFYGKPVVCLPVRGQAEQEMNTHYVERMGFGHAYRPTPGQVPDFRRFLDEEAAMRDTIERDRKPPGNQGVTELVLEWLAALR